MSDVTVVLRKARDLYAANPSHVRAEEYPRPGTYCPLTAVYEVSGACTRQSCDANNLLRHAAGRGDLPYWNAEVSTEAVLAAFDKAITKAEQSCGT